MNTQQQPPFLPQPPKAIAVPMQQDRKRDTILNAVLDLLRMLSK
ncbi:hypothetical protein [Parasegetibacter sp. NRK P23]|nr:hypothetical protein [Parasegetibacter sp. NRK P23]